MAERPRLSLVDLDHVTHRRLFEAHVALDAMEAIQAYHTAKAKEAQK